MASLSQRLSFEQISKLKPTLLTARVLLAVFLSVIDKKSPVISDRAYVFSTLT